MQCSDIVSDKLFHSLLSCACLPETGDQSICNERTSAQRTAGKSLNTAAMMQMVARWRYRPYLCVKGHELFLGQPPRYLHSKSQTSDWRSHRWASML